MRRLDTYSELRLNFNLFKEPVYSGIDHKWSSTYYQTAVSTSFQNYWSVQNGIVKLAYSELGIEPDAS